MTFLSRDGVAGAPAAPAAPASATTAPTAPAATAASPPAPATAPDAITLRGETSAIGIDELYDRIVKRLRRELLDDRERRGRSIGEGRW